MWNLKFLYTLLFIVHSLHHIPTVDGQPWKINKSDTNWTFSNDSPLPADNVTQVVEFKMGVPAPRLHVRGGPIKEDFTIVLFAIPFEENMGECPKADNFSKHENLRQNYWVKNITSQYPEVFDTSFRHIFTGCYYTVMINDREENFLARGPELYNTNYTFADDRLFAKTTVKAKPHDGSSSKGLVTTINVPSKLIEVIARLYAWNGKIVQTKNISLEEILKDRSSQKQWCKIRIDNNDPVWNCDKSVLTSKPILGVPRVGTKDNQWEVTFTWSNLSSQEDAYYLEFEPDFREWDQRYDRFTWLSARTSDIFQEIVADGDNDPASTKSKENESFPWIWIAIAIVIAAMVMIFILKILKHPGLPMLLKNMKNRRKRNQVREELAAPQFHRKKESENVLLIYSRERRENRPLNSEIEKLKRYLETHYPNCQVHDFFASRIDSNDCSSVWGDGVVGCIEKLLKKGSKVVWIDTPEFRSLMKGEQEQYTTNDGREDAIRYAISTTKDWLLKAGTQYRCHFVVRVKGYEITDKSENPLQIFTPHALYCIPDQLPLLCEKLGSTADDSENGVTTVETV